MKGAAVHSSALERFRPLLSDSEYATLLEEMARPLPQALRANPLKVDPAQAVPAWQRRYGWELEAVPFCPTGWKVLSSPAPVSQPVEHRMGQYYIQDAASMAPVELFDIQPGADLLALDLAASPGGKTTHLLGRMDDRGLVIANDPAADRVTALRLVLQTWGASGVMVTRFAGEDFGRWFPETFDRVLLDAPCSMQGLRSSESHPARPVSDKERSGLARRQAALLVSAFQALRAGGQVVYSTCTLSPEEDEGVVDALLKRFPGAAEVDDLSHLLDAPGLTAAFGQEFDPRTARCARLWPQRFGTAGFFAARLTKTAEVETAHRPPPVRPLERSGLAPLPRREAAALCARLQQTYGFDFAAEMEERALALWRHGGRIYALPDLWQRRFFSLPFQAVGMLLGSEDAEGFTPSHEWAARYGGRFRAGLVSLPPEALPAWLRGEDLPGDFPAQAGQVLLAQDAEGRILGLGRAGRGRLKNLLPRRLAY